MTDMAVANTILEQLGGNRFRVMTGAKNFMGDASSLTFRLPSTPHFVKQGINCVKVTLTPADTYTVEFMKIRGMKLAQVAEHSDVYAEDLRNLISETTGLALSLGSMGRKAATL